MEPGLKTGNGVGSEPARINMTMRGPIRSSLDQVNDKLGGFDPPEAQLMGLPFGQSNPNPDPTGETK
jgi:hypothetical protein